MKSGKTYNKMMRRSVRGTASRFFAILGIVALGTGFLCGLLSTEPDMKAGADKFFEEYSVMDLVIQGTLGLTEDDIAVLNEEPCVERAEGRHTQDLLMMDSKDEAYVTRIMGEEFGNTEGIDRLELLDGRWPEAADECVIEVPNAYAYDIGTGETLRIDPQNKKYKDLKKLLGHKEYKVVGTVRSPQFISMYGDVSQVGDGTLAMAMYVSNEEFDQDYYTACYVTLKGSRDVSFFSDEYRDMVEKDTKTIKAIGKERSKIRTAELKDDAMKEYRKGKKEFEEEKADALAKLDDAYDTLMDGKRQIDEGRQKIAEGRKEYKKGVAEIEKNRKKLKEGEDKLKEGKEQLAKAKKDYEKGLAEAKKGGKELAAARKKLDDSKKILDASKAELDKNKKDVDALKAARDAGMPLTPEMQAAIDAYDQGLAQWQAGMKEWNEADKTLSGKETDYEASMEQLEQAGATIEETESYLEDQAEAIEEGKEELEDGEEELAKAKKKLDKNEALLDEKEKEWQDGMAEYEYSREEAMEKLEEGEQELEDALRKIEDIENGKWILRDWEDNIGLSSYDDDTAKVGAIGKIFPVFFFLVAALVTLTTLTRMVEEERGRIGTLKSLGYTEGQILKYYLLYGGAASVLGCLVGIPFGCFFFPKVISNAYSMIYVLPPIGTPILWYIALPVSLGLIVMIELAVWMSCRDMLREKPAMLLLPKAPKVGKRILLERIGPIWRHLSFSRKVTLRNLFRYKKRFLMTIVGVAGCFALLLTGFGVRDSVGNIVRLQYDEIQHYDYMAQLDRGRDVKDDRIVREVLGDEELVSDYIQTGDVSVKLRCGGKKSSATLIIPKDPEKMHAYHTFRHRKGKSVIPFEADSLILTEKTAENLGVKEGDTLTLIIDDREYEKTLTGICEHYTGSYMYMQPDAYKEMTGSLPDFDSVYIKSTKEGKGGTVAEELLKSSRVIYVMDTDTIRDNFAESVKSIDYIVMVLIVASGALAIIVLYNLTNVNVCERKKELATIRVLGFYHKEVSAYVFREVNILSALGILFGIPAGVALHYYIIHRVEVASVMFGRTIETPSYFIAAALTVGFTILVNLIMRKPIRDIDMVESMKAND